MRGLKTEYDALTFKETPPPGADRPKDDADGVGDDDAKTDMSSGDINEIDRATANYCSRCSRSTTSCPTARSRPTDSPTSPPSATHSRSPTRTSYLEKPDDPAQMIPAATSVGDPFTADHTSVTVPGVSGTTRGTIAGMTGEAAELRNEARQVAQQEGMSQNIATVAWAGYQPPPNLGDPSMLTDDLAQAGAPKLTSFLHDLDAGSTNPNHTTALFGHSYGSLTSGIALQDGASKYVDNAVLYGSPGFQADTPAELGMNDDNFFLLSARDDPINTIGTLAPYHGWGSDPNDIIDEDGISGSDSNTWKPMQATPPSQATNPRPEPPDTRTTAATQESG
jgi:hypothetical protein